MNNHFIIINYCKSRQPSFHIFCGHTVIKCVNDPFYMGVPKIMVDGVPIKNNLDKHEKFTDDEFNEETQGIDRYIIFNSQEINVSWLSEVRNGNTNHTYKISIYYQKEINRMVIRLYDYSVPLKLDWKYFKRLTWKLFIKLLGWFDHCERIPFTSYTISV